MKKALIDVVFASEKRKNVLLLLHNGELEMKALLKALDTTRQALLPQMKVLEEHYLVDHYEDTYELTTIGKLVIDEMAPFLNTISVFDSDIDYWGMHNLDFIPLHLLERINELRYCKIIKTGLVNLFELNQDFIETSKQSAALFFVFTFMNPSFPPLISQFIKNNIITSIIVTKELLQKIKENWQVEAINFIASGKVKFYLYQSDLKMASLSMSDSCLVLRLLSKNNEFDNTQLFCCNSQAQQWGKALFEHYLKESTSVTEI